MWIKPEAASKPLAGYLANALDCTVPDENTLPRTPTIKLEDEQSGSTGKQVVPTNESESREKALEELQSDWVNTFLSNRSFDRQHNRRRRRARISPPPSRKSNQVPSENQAKADVNQSHDPISNELGSDAAQPNKETDSIQPAWSPPPEVKQRHPCPHSGCTRMFYRMYNLRKHLIGHGPVKPYCCKFPGCNKSFTRSTTVAKHEKTHLPDYQPVRFACPYPDCTRNFCQRYYLRQHLNRHIGVRPFPCRFPGCRATFTHTGARISHERTHLSKERRERFECPHSGCDHVYLSTTALEGHLNSHAGVRPYVCDVPGCNHAYTHETSLSSHKRYYHPAVIQPDRLFPCEHPNCDAKFVARQLLRQHMCRNHRVDRFRCKFRGCHFRFIRFASRLRHYRTHHNTPPSPDSESLNSESTSIVKSMKLEEVIRPPS